MKFATTIAVSLLLLCMTACEPVSWCYYTIDDEEGQAVVRLDDDVSIVLQGLSVGETPQAGSFQVEGPGGKLRVDKEGEIPVAYEYTHGHAVMSVGGRKFEILENGSELKIGDSVFDLREASADKPLMVTIDEAGALIP
jgi:hypothetical protein